MNRRGRPKRKEQGHQCPNSGCYSLKTVKDGFRKGGKNDGRQRWKCSKCGHRFIENTPRRPSKQEAAFGYFTKLLEVEERGKVAKNKPVASIIRSGVKLGVYRSTVYRWYKKWLEDGRPCPIPFPDGYQISDFDLHPYPANVFGFAYSEIPNNLKLPYVPPDSPPEDYPNLHQVLAAKRARQLRKGKKTT